MTRTFPLKSARRKLFSSSDLIRRSSSVSGRKSKGVDAGGGGFRSGSGFAGGCTGGAGASLAVFTLRPDWGKPTPAKTVIRRNSGRENFLMTSAPRWTIRTPVLGRLRIPRLLVARKELFEGVRRPGVALV